MKKEQLLKHLETKGFSKKILGSFALVKRENFIPENLQSDSYEDTALPIGNGQTISQPYTIAIMLSKLCLKKDQKVLEIGSGSGYVLALISNIIGKRGKIFGMEVIENLAKKSKESLRNYKNIQIYSKSGFKGLPEKAPFDRILISAAVHRIPKTLMSQLKEKGILVAPKGSRFEQSIITIQRKGNKFIIKNKIPGFIFVPLVEE
ncbi:MAG: protein-L-isoaspartate O-methyltransferase [Nanoarchaeota archaeon]|nr:protein-L-isoaspartate O-methyltransferase [Nanoarchaeota archaeon]